MAETPTATHTPVHFHYDDCPAHPEQIDDPGPCDCRNVAVRGAEVEDADPCPECLGAGYLGEGETVRNCPTCDGRGCVEPYVIACWERSYGPDDDEVRS